MYSALCSQPQPTGQTFDPSCAGGKQVNQAAKMSCLNKLNAVTCDEFNGATYDDDCELVCTTPTTGMGGTGGGGTGGTSGCGSVQPCGGDLVGTWTITGIRVNTPSMADPSCPGSGLSNVNATESGTVTYTAGGTYSTNIVGTLTYTETIPQSCIAPAICSDLVYSYSLIGAAATCSGTTVCMCTVAIAGTGAEAGSYSTSGTSVTRTDTATAGTDTMAYCVQGNTVHFLSFNTAGQVTSDEIAQRQ